MFKGKGTVLRIFKKQEVEILGLGLYVVKI
jgi:hypothetical protein